MRAVHPASRVVRVSQVQLRAPLRSHAETPRARSRRFYARAAAGGGAVTASLGIATFSASLILPSSSLIVALSSSEYT